MQVEHPVCCGIDVHKDTLTACLRRVDTNGQVSKEGREFATTSTSLLALADWLVETALPGGGDGKHRRLLEARLSRPRGHSRGVHGQRA